jgi:tetratricopeptide (TPR) repeat protein
MNKALLFLILFLPVASIQAQTLAKNDALKFDADYYLMEKEFGKAKNNYLNILKSEPDNADVKYRLGICYLNSEDEKEKAIPYLEEAAQKISEKYSASSFKETNAPIDALFLLGSAYRVNNEIDKAIEAYNRYKVYLDPKDNYNIEVIDQYIRNCNLARDMLKNPINMIATNMGKPINNELPNFNAVISGDGKTLVYTTPGRMGYNIFSSTFADTAWTTPKNITSVLGTGKYMKTSALSFDGLTLLLVLDDPMNADIYISHYIKNRWSKAEALSKEINSKSNETHASLSADGQALYFTSDRKGGEGDMDIYRSEPDAKGVWGKPVNLGSAINTPFNEETPFITFDGKMLYFSSEGHDGIGGYDIFRYDFNNPGAGAVNIGYPLNTTDNDLFFVPWGDGTTAYYSFRGSDTYGGRDIYRVTIPKEEVAVEEPVEEMAAAVEEPVEEMAAAVEEPVEAVTAAVEEPVEAIVAVAEEPVAIAVDEPVIEDVMAEEAVITAEDVEDAAVPEASDQFSTTLTSSDSFTTSDSEARSYLVQIMALKKPVDLSYFPGLSDITVAYSSDQWYRYTLGTTTEELKAEKILKELIEKGYRDAFIRKKNLIPQFAIQVMAVPGPVVDLNRFGNLPEISVKKGKDKFCRYTTGEFETKDEALANLEQIKKLGYTKAFIAKISIQQ